MTDETIHTRTLQDERMANYREKLLEIKQDTGLSWERIAHAIGITFRTILTWKAKGIKNPRHGSLTMLENFIKKYDTAKAKGLGVDFLDEISQPIANKPNPNEMPDIQ